MIAMRDLYGLVSDYELSDMIEIENNKNTYEVTFGGETHSNLSRAEAVDLVLESLHVLAANGDVAAIDLLEKIEDIKKEEEEDDVE